MQGGIQMFKRKRAKTFIKSESIEELETKKNKAVIKSEPLDELAITVKQEEGSEQSRFILENGKRKYGRLNHKVNLSLNLKMSDLSKYNRRLYNLNKWLK